MTVSATVLDEHAAAIVRLRLAGLAEQVERAASDLAQVPPRSFGGSPTGIEVAAERAGALRTQEAELRAVAAYLVDLVAAFDATVAAIRSSDEQAEQLVAEVTALVAGAGVAGAGTAGRWHPRAV